MSIPESDLAWQCVYDYVYNSLALTENDARPGEPVDVPELFIQRISDVAKVEMKQYHIGGGRMHERLEWQEPVNDERVPGLESLIRWLNERTPGAGPTYNVQRTYFLENLVENNSPLAKAREVRGEGSG